MKNRRFKKVLTASLAFSMVAVMAAPLCASAEEAAVTGWKDLYKSLQVDTSATGEGYYDAVSSATGFSSRHAGDIPSVVAKAKDSEGKITALTGVTKDAANAQDAQIETKLSNAEWTDDSKYGTDEFVIYPDDTVAGYVWNTYLDNLYAATISDGTVTVGAVPWIDYYGEKAEKGYHYNKVQIALNQGISKGANQAVVHRYDSFYKDGSLKPGTYTVTLYAKGFTPLKAEISVVAYSYMYAALTQQDYWANEGVSDSSPAGKGSELYVPVRVATKDAKAFQTAYKTVANGAVLPGSKLKAEVDRATNGLKTAVKNADGTFSFTAARTGTGSGLKDASLTTVEADKLSLDIKVGKMADTAGELLRVDVKGNDLNDFTKNLYAITWKYFGETNPLENRRAAALTTYGTKPYQNILTGDNTLPLTLTLPEGAARNGYWQAVLTASGYANTTLNFTVSDENYQDSDLMEGLTKEAVITVKTVSKTCRAKVLAKKALSFSIGASINSNATLSYKKISGSSKITINQKTGKVTVKKKAAKGTYKIKIKIQAPATKGYTAATLTKTIKVIVK